MKALLIITVLFTSVSSFAQIPGETKEITDVWTTFYNPRANGLPIRVKSTSEDGICLYKNKFYGAVEKSLKPSKHKTEKTVEVSRKGIVDAFPSDEKSRYVEAISCFNYEQPKKRKKRK